MDQRVGHHRSQTDRLFGLHLGGADQARYSAHTGSVTDRRIGDAEPAIGMCAATAAVSSAFVPVRVLWLIKGLGPGGAETLLAAAARAHDHDAFHIECAYVLPYKDHLAEQLEQSGVRCHCLSTTRSDPRWPIRLRRLISDGQFDIVHSHSPLPAAVGRIVAMSLPRARRPMLVTTEHNAWDTLAAPTRWANRLTSWLDDAVYAVSNETKRSMRGRAADGDASPCSTGSMSPAPPPRPASAELCGKNSESATTNW